MRFLLSEAADAGADPHLVDMVQAAVGETEGVGPGQVVVHLSGEAITCEVDGASPRERAALERHLRARLPDGFTSAVHRGASERQIVGVVIDAMQEGRDEEAHALLEEQREQGDEAKLMEAVAEEIRRRGLPIW